MLLACEILEFPTSVEVVNIGKKFVDPEPPNNVTEVAPKIIISISTPDSTSFPTPKSKVVPDTEKLSFD